MTNITCILPQLKKKNMDPFLLITFLAVIKEDILELKICATFSETVFERYIQINIEI